MPGRPRALLEGLQTLHVIIKPWVAGVKSGNLCPGVDVHFRHIRRAVDFGIARRASEFGVDSPGFWTSVFLSRIFVLVGS